MEKVLVIGASGLLGSKLMEIGKEKNYKLYGTYFQHKIALQNIFPLDVTKRKKVFDLIKKIKPDLVIDTHSITNVDYCELYPEQAWRVNVDGTKNIVEACKVFGAKIIFISSDYVFPGGKSEYGEKDKPKPLNYYGKTKVIGEKIIQYLDIDYIIIRTSVILGIGGLGKKPFVLWVLENLNVKKEINVVIDQFNNPTLADNLAEILFKLFNKDAYGLFHVVGKDHISRYELALKVAKSFNLDKNLIRPITTPELRQPAIRPRKLQLSTKKLQRFLGITPIGVDESLNTIKRQLK